VRGGEAEGAPPRLPVLAAAPLPALDGDGTVRADARKCSRAGAAAEL